MTTRRKIPHSRVPMADETGRPTREWYLLLEREAHVGAVATSAVAGTASALPGVPAGYITIEVNGEPMVQPYWNPPP